MHFGLLICPLAGDDRMPLARRAAIPLVRNVRQNGSQRAAIEMIYIFYIARSRHFAVLRFALFVAVNCGAGSLAYLCIRCSIRNAHIHLARLNLCKHSARSAPRRAQQHEKYKFYMRAKQVKASKIDTEHIQCRALARNPNEI